MTGKAEAMSSNIRERLSFISNASAFLAGRYSGTCSKL
jgi:hypothetical protein